ncbi:MAG: corrinoid protein [Clostridiales Family XIII bacterium]|nr:corrinoid protein [Clostridiales Family XIII bacterium]
MSESKQEIFKGLSDAVFEFEEDEAVAYAHKAVDAGIDATEAIESGLADGMQRAGVLYEEEEYFISELLLCADALNAGVEVLKPHIRTSDKDAKTKVVIGVIEGDTHDIGKNLVRILTEAGGYEVLDLGRDVKPEAFVETAAAEGADVIALSTLMTTTMVGMPKVIELLKERGLRDRVKVVVGGGPISQGYADRIGADGYAPNASEAVRLIERVSKA